MPPDWGTLPAWAKVAAWLGAVSPLAVAGCWARGLILDRVEQNRHSDKRLEGRVR